MAPQYYRRGQEAKSARIEQPPTGLLRYGHTAVLTHRQLDDVAVAAEPAARRLEVRGIDEQRQRRGGERGLRSNTRLRHRPRPQRGAVLRSQPVDAADLREAADTMHLDIPDFG